MASFVPRATFPDLLNLPRSYFLGHHASGLRKMQALAASVDLVVECRDYRIPLSSQNPMFEDALLGKPRIIVYTKKDLGRGVNARAEDDRRENLLRQYYHPIPLVFHSSGSVIDTRKVLTAIRQKCADGTSIAGKRVLMVGMPNVGKSSLLNALREEGLGAKWRAEGRGKVAKAARTGNQPGVTRKIPTSVKILEGTRDGDNKHEEDDVYVLDTPGVFVPYVSNSYSMLKLALTGAVKDSVIAPTILADYLLFHLNRRPPARPVTKKMSADKQKAVPRYLEKPKPQRSIDKPAPRLQLPKTVINPERPGQKPIKVLNPGSDPRSAPTVPPPAPPHPRASSISPPESVDPMVEDVAEAPATRLPTASDQLFSRAPRNSPSTLPQASAELLPALPLENSLAVEQTSTALQKTYHPESFGSRNEVRSWYSYFHEPTNNIIALLHAIALRTGRLMALPRNMFSRYAKDHVEPDFHLPEESYRDPDNPDTRIRIVPEERKPEDVFKDLGGEIDKNKYRKKKDQVQHPDIEASAVWLIQQWREGKFGKLVLDDVTPESLLAREQEEIRNAMGGLKRGMKIEKQLLRQRSISRAIGVKRIASPIAA